MSDLQIGLIGLAVLAILGLFLHGWWQDRRARKQIEMPKGKEDPLAPNKESEESASHTGNLKRRKPRAKQVEPSVSAKEPTLYKSGQLEYGPSVESSSDNDHDAPDLACEAVIDLILEQPLKGEEIIPFTSGLKHAGTKKITVYAQTAQSLHHASLRPQEKYVQLQFAILLVNRSGSIQLNEWNEVNSRIRVLAEQFRGRIESPSFSELSDQAQQLDAICAELDAQISLTLLATSAPWEASDVIHAALELGASGPHQGRLEWLDSEGRIRFTLVRHGGVSIESLTATGIDRLHFILDVPRCLPEKGMFARMAAIARKLAVILKADLVDHSGKALPDRAEQQIDTMLEAHVQRLEQHYLAAGSVRARKVFND